MKRILITGGAGFIGSRLALKLISKGYTVTVLDTLSPQIHGADAENKSELFTSIKDKVRFIKGSVTSRETLAEAMKGQDVIVHYAAETGTGQSMYQIEQYINVNVSGTGIMLDLLANSKYEVRKVVVASSRAIYGEGRYRTNTGVDVYPAHRTEADLSKRDFEVKYPGYDKLTLVATDETSKIHPSSVYGITKQTQEDLVMTVCPTLGIAPVAFRYQNVYGPGQSLINPYTGILSIFSTLIRSGKEINIFEDGLESRDFVFIDDVVDATILGIEKPEGDGQIFNVGTGIPTTVLAVAGELMNRFGREVPLRVSGNFRLGDIRHNYADLTRIQSKLGFVPKVNFKEGIRRFVEWVLGQELRDGKYEASLAEMKGKGLLK